MNEIKYIDMKIVNVSTYIGKITIVLLLILHPLFSIIFYKGYFLLVIFGVFIVLLLDFIGRRGKLWFDERPIAVYCLLFLPIVSVLWSMYPIDTIRRGLLVLVNIGIFYLMMRVEASEKNKLISNIVTVLPIIWLIVFLIIYLKFGSVRINSIAMREVVKSLCNVGPSVVVPCIPFIFLLPEFTIHKIRTWIILLACIFVVFLSESRGGLIVFLLSIPITLYFDPRKNKILRIVKFLKFGLPLGVIICCAFLLININKFIAPVFDRFENSQLISVDSIVKPSKDKDDYGRAVIISEGIKIIIENPFSGIGYGSLFSYLNERYGFGFESHNIFITAWSEMGILGLSILIWNIIYLLINLNKCYKNKKFSINNKLVTSATYSALIIIFIHAQLRPVFDNPMLPIILAQAYTMIRFNQIQTN